VTTALTDAVDTPNSRRSVGKATLTTVESMIVMNITATNTTLTESLGLRGSGQRVLTHSSRQTAVLIVPSAPGSSAVTVKTGVCAG
jgi:hypothetical protein